MRPRTPPNPTTHPNLQAQQLRASILTLHWHGRMSYPQLAHRLGVDAGYAQRIVDRAKEEAGDGRGDYMKVLVEILQDEIEEGEGGEGERDQEEGDQEEGEGRGENEGEGTRA